MLKLKKVTLSVATALAAFSSWGAVQEKPSTLSDQQSVAVTIYNENLALIKDLRRVTFEAGRNRLALREVSGRMRPETALLRSVSHPGTLSLLEQNFDFDLLTPAKLLEKYVGRNVRIIKTHPTTGAETIETATVLAANGGVVLKIGDRIETGLPGRIVYDARAGQPARPADAGHRARCRPRGQPVGRALLPLGRALLEGGLRRRAERRGQRARPQRLGDADQHQRHLLPEREAPARRRRCQPSARRNEHGSKSFSNERRC